MINDDQNELYAKYMAFNRIMLEEHRPIELAAIMIIQGLSMYRTVMSEEDYLKIVDTIYARRNDVQTFESL